VFLGYVDAAMKTALYLREYEDIIDPCDAYSLLGKIQVIGYTILLAHRRIYVTAVNE